MVRCRSRLGLGVVARVAMSSLALALIVAERAVAQDAAPRPQAAIAEKAGAATLPSKLPGDVKSRHFVELPGRTLRFTATAGSIPIRDDAGQMLADVGYTSYVLDRPVGGVRPLAFAFNGGPGSASAWLQLGAMGPWRVPLTPETMATKGAPELIGNADTWLDFVDLVFIDPPGTGHSRIWPKDPEQGPAAQERRGRDSGAREAAGRQWFWSVRGDIETFNEVIKTLARQMQRLDSPIVLVGESYGGFRVPLIADSLTRDHGMGIFALVMASPVLDFDARRGGYLPMHYVGLLPSLAATRLERAGTEPTRELLRTTEAYARGDYLVDLMRGARDVDAIARMSGQVGEITGLLPDYVRSMSGRINARGFLIGHQMFGREAVSLYDAGMPGLGAPQPGQQRGGGDPFTNRLSAPLTDAMGALHARLGWTTDRPYVLLSREVVQSWNWRNSPYSPQSLDALQAVMQGDQRRRALVAHGFTDLVTPYMMSALQLDLTPAHEPSHGVEHRIQFEVYPGGHMFYSRDGSRARFRADSERVIGAAVEPPRSTNGGARETP